MPDTFSCLFPLTVDQLKRLKISKETYFSNQYELIPLKILQNYSYFTLQFQTD